jgi:hypothetical protein
MSQELGLDHLGSLDSLMEIVIFQMIRVHGMPHPKMELAGNSDECEDCSN